MRAVAVFTRSNPLLLLLGRPRACVLRHVREHAGVCECVRACDCMRTCAQQTGFAGCVAGRVHASGCSRDVECLHCAVAHVLLAVRTHQVSIVML